MEVVKRVLLRFKSSNEFAANTVIAFSRHGKFRTYGVLHNNASSSLGEEVPGNTESSVQSENMRRLFTSVAVPNHIAEAAKRLLDDNEKKDVLLKAKKLCQVLHSRRLPMEKVEYDFRSEKILRKCPNDGDIEKLVQKELSNEIYRWKPIVYDECTSKSYMAGRLAANYAALSSVFKEVKADLPSFQPQSFFDYGSGIGTALWTAYEEWGNVLSEYFCVDTSRAMLNLAELLIKEGMEEPTEFLKKVYFRQFLPESSLVKFDLVVSAYSLMELPSMHDRLKVIDILWRKTNDVLVIIENGSRAGFSAVLDARDYILHIEREHIANDPSNSSKAHVVAPCSHDMLCPKFTSASRIPCNFVVHYPTIFKHPQGIKQERFSYVVLQKRGRKPDSEPWPRIMSKIKKRSKVANCILCCSDGKLHQIAFTKSKHGSDIYTCVKKSKCGNLLPISMSALPKQGDRYVCENTNPLL